jgi:hypothetical protein
MDDGDLERTWLDTQLRLGIVGEKAGCGLAVLVGVDLPPEDVGQLRSLTTEVATAVVIQRIFLCSSTLAASGTAWALE